MVMDVITTPSRMRVHGCRFFYSQYQIWPFLAGVQSECTIVDRQTDIQFSVPQIEYPLGGSSKKGSHVYFLLIVAMVLLL